MTQSIEKLQKKLDKDPNSLIFFQLAEEHRKEGNIDNALSILEQGLSRHPNYWSARVTFARIHYQQGNIHIAQQELEKVVQAVPDHLLANRMLGEIYLSKNLNQDALKRFQIVHMLNPADQEIAGHIKKLEAESIVSQPEPQLESAIPVPPPFPVAASDEPQQQEEQTDPETFAPTIQMMPLPEFLEKTEIIARPFAEVPLSVPDPVVQEVAAVESNDTFLREEEKPESGQQDEEYDLVVESAEPILDEAKLPEPPTHAEELSNIAKLLMTVDDSRDMESGFQELEPEIEDSDFEIEQDAEVEPPKSRQDSTQPIDESEEENDADELTTETLAELYLNQGLVDKAAKVYQKLLLNDPGNPFIQERLRRLTSEEAVPEIEEEKEESLEEPVMVEAKLHGLNESADADPIAQRAEERRRKINTLENWLTTIRRDR